MEDFIIQNGEKYIKSKPHLLKKSKKKKPKEKKLSEKIPLALSPEMKKSIEKIAEDTGLSEQNIIRMCISSYLNQNG